MNDATTSIAAIAPLHSQIQDSPYSIKLRLELAQLYRESKYPDLSIGEAYKGLLLIDEILDEHGEYHEQALSAAKAAIAAKDNIARYMQASTNAASAARLDSQNGIITQDSSEVEFNEVRHCIKTDWLPTRCVFAYSYHHDRSIR